MKKSSRMFTPRGSNITNTSQHKIVDIIEGEKVNIEDRTYGTMKSRQSITPYPRRATPIDLACLSAKLDAEKKQARVSINSGMIVKPGSFHNEYEDNRTERHRNFAERRKQFDEGEFTICKGRKLGDDFHPLESRATSIHLDALYNSLMEGKNINVHNFDEMGIYCRESNLRLSTLYSRHILGADS